MFFRQLTIYSIRVAVLLVVGLALTMPSRFTQAQSSSIKPEATCVAIWTGAADDGDWRNSANWSGQRVPGAQDHVRLSGAQNIWLDAAGTLAELELADDFSGVLYLAQPLFVRGGLMVKSGRLAQGRQPIRVGNLQQSGGEVVGGSATFTVEGAAQVQAGLWTTPGTLTTARSLDIAQDATVRLGANGSLVLTGDGSPLTGRGLLDVMTYRPNSVELKGHVAQDLLLAGPASQFRAAGLDRQGYQAARGNSIQRPSVTSVFTEVASLNLLKAENRLTAAVLDEANGYAYFGTTTAPASVVKVDVSPARTFARVGVVTLNTGEDYLSSAVIDAANGLAYFGTGTAPGRVIKVDVNPAHTLSRIDTLLLDPGEDNLRAAVVDNLRGLAYFGTGTYPGRVIRVDVDPTHSFTRTFDLTFNYNIDGLTSAVLDVVNSYAYFGTGASAGYIVKVDVNPEHPMARIDEILLNVGENFLNSAVIDAANGYAYFGTANSPASIIKVDVDPARVFARVDAAALDPQWADLTSAAIDPAHGYAYFGTDGSPGRVVKIDVNPTRAFTVTDSVVLNWWENVIASVVLDASNGLAYFGTYNEPGIVVKVDVNPAHTLARVDAITLSAASESDLTTCVVDIANGFAYFGTLTGIVVKVDINPAHPMTRVGAVTLDFSNGETNLESALLDPARHFAYFGTRTSPGRVVKLDVDPAHPFARVDSIKLNDGEDGLVSAVMDTANGYAYFGTYTQGGGSPGKIVRVDVGLGRPFTRTTAITLDATEQGPFSAVLDAPNGYAYFGVSSYPGNVPGRVIKVDVNPLRVFQRVDTLLLKPSDNTLTPAVLDSATGYAYFGTSDTLGAYPIGVIQIDVNPARPFTRTAAIALSTETFSIGPAVLDGANGFAYFSISGVSWRIFQVNVGSGHPLTVTDSIVLNSGGGLWNSAGIDPANGFAYYGGGSSSGVVTRVALGYRHRLFLPVISKM